MGRSGRKDFKIIASLSLSGESWIFVKENPDREKKKKEKRKKNADGISNNYIFTVKGKKLYVPVVTLLTKDNHKIFQNLFERSVYQNGYKTKSERNNTTNEYRYFLNQTL